MLVGSRVGQHASGRMGIGRGDDSRRSVCTDLGIVVVLRVYEWICAQHVLYIG